MYIKSNIVHFSSLSHHFSAVYLCVSKNNLKYE